MKLQISLNSMEKGNKLERNLDLFYKRQAYVNLGGLVMLSGST